MNEHLIENAAKRIGAAKNPSGFATKALRFARFASKALAWLAVAIWLLDTFAFSGQPSMPGKKCGTDPDGDEDLCRLINLETDEIRTFCAPSIYDTFDDALLTCCKFDASVGKTS